MRIAALVLSLVLHTGAMAPWNISGIAWFCLVPFFVALDGLAPRQAFLVGLFWGTAQIWLVCPWTAVALSFYWDQPWWFGAGFLLVASAIFVGVYYGLFAWAFVVARERSAGSTRALWVAALWVAAELAQARLLGGDPWMLLGYALTPSTAMIQIADVGGVYVLSFVVALVNASFYELWRSRRAPRRTAPTVALALGAFALTLVYGVYRTSSPLPPSETRRVAIVQGNNRSGWQWNSEFHGESLASYLRLSAAAARSVPDTLIWPESAVTFFVASEEYYKDKIASLVRRADVDLILGGPHVDTTDVSLPRYFNSAFHMNASGDLTGRYDKVHLLPFAEYFPLQTLSVLRRQFGRVRTFTPGGAPQLLDTRLGPVAVVICFEGIFPRLVRERMAAGAGVLVNLSNDSWLGNYSGPEQHLAMVRLRAVEHRTWLIRATTTGVSAIIDPWGRTIRRSEMFEEAVLVEEIGIVHNDTVYETVGDGFAYLCVAGGLAAFVVRWRRRPESKLDS